MLEKARKLPLLTKIVFTIIFSLIWIFIASIFEMDIKSNWILSGLVIAAVSSVFVPFSKKEGSNKKE